MSFHLIGFFLISTFYHLIGHRDNRDNYPSAVGVNHGDRGYGAPHNQPVVNRPVVATVGRSVSDSAAPRRTTAPAARPEAPATRTSMPAARTAPASVQHSAPISRPESSGAFIGIQSSHDTKAFSNRGQQSMQTTTHSAPASRPAPSSGGGGGGGGGGGHNSNSPQKH